MGQPLGTEEITNVALRIAVPCGQGCKGALTTVHKEHHSLQTDKPDRHCQQDVQSSGNAAVKDVENRDNHNSVDGCVDDLDGREYGAQMVPMDL